MWQGGLLLFAVLFLVFEVWRGWRAGVARAGINFAAIVLSTLAAWFAGEMAAAPFGGFQEPGGFLAALIMGGGLGCFVFIVLWLTGIIFFKRTDHQGSGLVRIFWGAGGAFFGLLVAVVILWGGISMIRSMGALAEARVELTKTTASPTKVAGAPVAAATPPPLASNILKLKESLELGPAGKFVESVDLLPPGFYELIVDLGRLSGDQQALVRFFEYPGMKEIISNSKLGELLADPEIVKAGEEKNVAALLTNPKLRKAVEDPALAEQLKKVDLRAAMKFALEKPAPQGGERSTPTSRGGPPNAQRPTSKSE